MSVTVRPYRNGGWEVDIQYRSPDGRRRRERKRVSIASKSAAQRWGEERERALLVSGPAPQRKEVPRFEEFWPRFLEGHARANRQKPSGIATKELLGRVHLLPMLGVRRLDGITTEDVQRLKGRLREKAPKTVNNVLSVLSVVLKKAMEWDVIERLPCTIKLLPIPKPAAKFHDFADYERLVEAARAIDSTTLILVLLGGEAGLRCGEMMALQWTDVDLRKRHVCVQRSDWKGHVTTTKGGRLRHVPLTRRLAAELQAHRHLRSARVVCRGDGTPLTQKIVRECVRRAARRADVTHEGVHVLRHTFCSHLAMRGAPARAIQELAGHQDLATTQRYMHLSPAAIADAIRLLDAPPVAGERGDIVESAP
jgi:integrase